MMGVFGANLHPDRRHLVAASETIQERIKEGMSLDQTSVLNWTSPYTAVEPRLFPRLFSKYGQIAGGAKCFIPPGNDGRLCHSIRGRPICAFCRRTAAICT